MFLIFNSALKGLDDTLQPKSKAAARWIIVKVHDLNKTSTYIYCLCVCTLIDAILPPKGIGWKTPRGLG